MGFGQFRRQGEQGPVAVEGQGAMGVDHTGEHQAGPAELQATAALVVHQGADLGAQQSPRRQASLRGTSQIEAAGTRHRQPVGRHQVQATGGLGQGAQQSQRTGAADLAWTRQGQSVVAHGAAAVGAAVDAEISAVAEPQTTGPHRTAEAGHGGGQGLDLAAELVEAGHHQGTGLDGGTSKVWGLPELSGPSATQPHRRPGRPQAGDHHRAGADGPQGYGALGAAVGVGLQRAAARDPQGRRHAAQTSALQADGGGAEVGAAVAQATAEPAPIAHQTTAAHAQAAGGPQRSQDQVGTAGDGGIGTGLQREAAHARGADPQGRGSAADVPLGGPQFNRTFPVTDANAVGGLGQGRGHQAHQAMGFDG